MRDLILERTMDAPPRSGLEGLDRSRASQGTGGRRNPNETPRNARSTYRPGGIFYTRMTGPDRFDIPSAGCFLEIVPRRTDRVDPRARAPPTGPTEIDPPVIAAASPSPPLSPSRTPTTAARVIEPWPCTRMAPTARPTARWASTKAGAPAPASSKTLRGALSRQFETRAGRHARK